MKENFSSFFGKKNNNHGDNFLWFSKTGESGLVNYYFSLSRRLNEIKEIEGASWLINKRGWEGCPIIISSSVISVIRAKSLFTNLFMEGQVDNADKTASMVEALAEELVKIKIIDERWKRDFLTEPSGDVTVEGFESFNFPSITEEMVKKVKEMFIPEGLRSPVFVRRIRRGEGAKGKALARFSPKGREIVVFPSSLEDLALKEGLTREEILKSLPYIIAREYGYALDPRVVDQPDLPPLEQLRMIIEWKQLLESLGLNENLDGSKGLWAETVGYFLTLPDDLLERSPRLYDFMTKWFMRRFPNWKLDHQTILKNLSEFWKFIDNYIKRGD